MDVGATNVRTVAVNSTGKIVASRSYANETDDDPFLENGRIWDVDKIWNKLSLACKDVINDIDSNRIAGVTVTTFGVDGTFVDESGNPTYPVISWQCMRTAPIMKNIDDYISLQELYNISGVYPFAFNTINKLIWFKENKPEIIEKSHSFVFITSLLISRLTGVIMNDTTMMGTSMLADLRSREFSTKIMNALGFDASVFGELVNPGDNAGKVTSKASVITGLPVGTPVFFAGHDTQFAVFGSGAKLNQPVLSSGTWEVLMTRSDCFSASDFGFDNNLTTEADAIPGYYNIGQNWLGSGVLEWFSGHFYSGLTGDNLYNTMIGEAQDEDPGCDGLIVDPAFYDGDNNKGGVISGLSINTGRGKLYRAFLEGLSCRLREGMEALEKAGSFKTDKIICVGGGSKNKLWNQIRADVCNVPVQLIDQKETTVLGASFFVFAGLQPHVSPEDMRENIDYKPELIYPSENSAVYNDLYKRYLTFKAK